VFFDLRTPEEKVMIVRKLLSCKVALTSIRFALGVTEETVLSWLARAAEKAEAINQQLLREVVVTEVQLDELWRFIRRKKSQAAAADGENLDESSDGRQWVWVSFAPEFRLLLAVFVGPRTCQSALSLLKRTAAIVLGIPCFFSHGCSSYLPALVAVYPQLKTFPRTGQPGRPRQPVQEPHPDLAYTQLVKHKQQGRLKTLTQRVCCGAARLAKLGLKISTSLVERFNLTLRQALAPLVRKSLGFCKDRTQLRRRLLFYQVYYNFARPHHSLRQPCPPPEPLSQPPTTTLFQLKWQPVTPGMAAGLTDHVWSFRELLAVKFEPIHDQSISG
jgi:IS1 family transposase